MTERPQGRTERPKARTERPQAMTERTQGMAGRPQGRAERQKGQPHWLPLDVGSHQASITNARSAASTPLEGPSLVH
jgi:hypothetical protein